jgi:hypothetical protein
MVSEFEEMQYENVDPGMAKVLRRADASRAMRPKMKDPRKSIEGPQILLPEPFRKKVPGLVEADIQEALLRVLRKEKGLVRINSQDIATRGQCAGWPDAELHRPGYDVMFIECKAPGGHVRSSQIARFREIYEKTGIVVILLAKKIYTFNDLTDGVFWTPAPGCKLWLVGGID